MEDEKERQRMEDARRKEEERKKSENLLLMSNPFPNIAATDQFVVHLGEEFFGVDSTVVINRHEGSEVELDGVGQSAEGKPENQSERQEARTGNECVCALAPIDPKTSLPSQALPSVRASSWGAFSLGMWHSRTPFAAALQKGTLNEKNPVRDRAWGTILGLAGLGTLVFATIHGNVPLIIFSLLILSAAVYLHYRASQGTGMDAGVSSEVPTGFMYMH